MKFTLLPLAFIAFYAASANAQTKTLTARTASAAAAVALMPRAAPGYGGVVNGTVNCDTNIGHCVNFRGPGFTYGARKGAPVRCQYVDQRNGRGSKTCQFTSLASTRINCSTDANSYVEVTFGPNVSIFRAYGNAAAQWGSKRSSTNVMYIAVDDTSVRGDDLYALCPVRAPPSQDDDYNEDDDN